MLIPFREGDTVEFEVDFRQHGKFGTTEPCAVKVKLLGGLSFMESAKLKQRNASEIPASSTNTPAPNSVPPEPSKPPSVPSLAPAWKLKQAALEVTSSAPATPTGQVHTTIPTGSPAQLPFVSTGGSITPAVLPAYSQSHASNPGPTKAPRSFAPNWKQPKQHNSGPGALESTAAAAAGPQTLSDSPKPFPQFNPTRASSNPQLAITGTSMPKRRDQSSSEHRY